MIRQHIVPAADVHENGMPRTSAVKSAAMAVEEGASAEAAARVQLERVAKLRGEREATGARLIDGRGGNGASASRRPPGGASSRLDVMFAPRALGAQANPPGGWGESLEIDIEAELERTRRTIAMRVGRGAVAGSATLGCAKVDTAGGDDALCEQMQLDLHKFESDLTAALRRLDDVAAGSSCVAVAEGHGPELDPSDAADGSDDAHTGCGCDSDIRECLAHRRHAPSKKSKRQYDKD